MRRSIPALLSCLLPAVPALSQAPAAAALPPAPADLATPAADVRPSGLASRVLAAGRGTVHPRPQDVVRAHFSLWSSEGACLSSTLKNAEPAELFLDRVMKGMSEGIQLMVAGEKRRLWIPEALAFAGAKGKPAGPVVMDVELLTVDPPPTEAPADVATPPAEAQLLPSGLAYRVLRPGSGPERAKPYSRVTVHYSGWTTDGKLFDSSVLRREPATFRLDEVIKGWTQGVVLMAKGEKTRFWIPEKLAYRGEKGKPAGMLVFDVELLTIHR